MANGNGHYRREQAETRNDAIQVVRLADVEPRPIEWLWSGRIAAGKLTLFAGDPGLGKSQIAINIAARVTDGGEWPDGGTPPIGNVVMLSAEDDVADTLRPRFEAAGGHLDRCHVVRGIRSETGGQRTFSLQGDLDLLGAQLAAVGNVKLVIIDPVTCYCGKVHGNSTTDIRGLLAPLTEF